MVNKHGKVVDVIFDGMSEEESLLVEQDVIAELRYFSEPLTNITSGGDGIRSIGYPSELRVRMSKVTSARRPEVRAKISKSSLGRKLSEETKKKLSESSKKMWIENRCKHEKAARDRVTPEWIEKNRQAQIKANTEEVRKKKSDSAKIRKATPEIKRILSAAKKHQWRSDPVFAAKMKASIYRRPVKCSNGMIFDSSVSAAQWVRDNQGNLLARQSNITSACSGALKTAYGYKWEYLEER